MTEFTSKWLNYSPSGNKVNKDSVTSGIVILCLACQGELSPYLDRNDKGGLDLGWRCSDCKTVWFGLDKVSARLGRSDD